MFDKYSQELISQIPELSGLDRSELFRVLSAGYLAIVQFRLGRSPERTLESMKELSAVANRLVLQVVLHTKFQKHERQAAAFVSAEAISLVSKFLDLEIDESTFDSETYDFSPFLRIEAALLYLFSEFDVCAAGVFQDQRSVENTYEGSILDVSLTWAFSHLKALCCLDLGGANNEDFGYRFFGCNDLSPSELEEDTTARVFVELGEQARQYSSWLRGDLVDLKPIIDRLDKIISTLGSEQTDGGLSIGWGSYSRASYLAKLMRLTFPTLGERSLIRRVPSPPNGDADAYSSYLEGRAKGSKNERGRPVLWPSANSYVESCFVKGVTHAVVAMPTGSGKSFVGELAVSQAVQDGWALYLAPTNALTEQIRRDLRSGLNELGTEVLSFVGNQEYSILESDRVSEMETNSVAVMTPEKCALALRLSPEVFQNCRLVIFDECHLIGGDGSRGQLAELVVTQLILRAPLARFLLMSAIIQNPDNLAGWLSETTGKSSETISIKWRPTRTLRSIAGIRLKSLRAESQKAEAAFEDLPLNRKNLAFGARFALAANLRGAWESLDIDDHKLVSLNCKAQLRLKRNRSGDDVQFKVEDVSWVNASAKSLGLYFAGSGIQTLIFISKNKHYAFGNAAEVDLGEAVIDSLPRIPQLLESYEVLAKLELGCDSEVFTLIKRGISVHTGAMIETEKRASEESFKCGSSILMFATATLAQGLNLPAMAVVIAGSTIGDERGKTADELRRRKLSQFLNAAGRAGRAGFANQGIVVAIPDKPLVLSSGNFVEPARERVDFLQSTDDAVRVESQLEGFLDSVCEQLLSENSASPAELLTLSMLSGGDELQLNPADVLNRSYAAYFRKLSGKDNVSYDDAKKLVDVGSEFVTRTGAQDWTLLAAQRAGLDFFQILSITSAWGKVRKEFPDTFRSWTVSDWLSELLEIIPHIPPGRLGSGLGAMELKNLLAPFETQTERGNPVPIFAENELNFLPSQEWKDAWKGAEDVLFAWINGENVAKIGATLLSMDSTDIPPTRGSGHPIPKTLGVIDGPIGSLSLVAGGLLAIAEQIFKGDIPQSLACLPMCLRYGFDSPESLAWFRFGIRLRVPAHYLAKRFPPPPNLEDTELKSWVDEKRKSWLGEELEDDPIFAAMKSFLKKQ